MNKIYKASTDKATREHHARSIKKMDKITKRRYEEKKQQKIDKWYNELYGTASKRSKAANKK